MPVVWNLKKWLAVERNIYRPSELQTVLAEKAGVQISLQALSALMNGIPSGLRFQTIQALCDALDCELTDFCNVIPSTSYEKQKQRKVVGDTTVRLYGAKEKPKGEESIFPDPHRYMTKEKDQRDKRAKDKEIEE